MLCESGEFVINLTTEELARATDYAGIYTGAKVDKFEKAGLLPVRSKCVGAPSLAESPLSLECRVFEVLEMGTHHVFMADIVNVSVRVDIMDKEGKIRLDKAGLLAYAHGEYYALGKRVGKFGFSATKKKKSKARRKGNSPKSAPSN
jgi:flavin reductase (DIM6/NTAB) family NADH-FMN oxidoreductase RutF